MKTEQHRPVDRMSYEKPTAVDMGPAAPVIGGSCAVGDRYDDNSVCIFYGNHAENGCFAGNEA